MVNLTGPSNTKLKNKDYWQTPYYLIPQIEGLFDVKIKLDPCSKDIISAKASQFFNEKENGLNQDWSKHLTGDNDAAFVNPPFSNILPWINKSIEECKKGCKVVFLHPHTADTDVYQLIESHTSSQLSPTQRLGFIDSLTGKVTDGVNFPSIISLISSTPVKTQDIKLYRFKLNNGVERRSSCV